MKTIKVKSPKDCPFLWVDAEGYVENSCEIVEHFLDNETIFNLKTHCGGKHSGDVEKFPDWCPLFHETVFVEREC